MTQSAETASLIAAIREAHEILGKHPTNVHKLKYGEEGYCREARYAWLVLEDKLKGIDGVAPPVTQKRILILDDEADKAADLARRLKRRGYMVLPAVVHRTTMPFVEMQLKSNNWDLVISDYTGMPIEQWSQMTEAKILLWTNHPKPLERGQVGHISKRSGIGEIVFAVEQYSR